VQQEGRPQRHRHRGQKAGAPAADLTAEQEGEPHDGKVAEKVERLRAQSAVAEERPEERELK
jgi:hypothetical protein